MAAAMSTPTTSSEPRWGLGDALAGWLVATLVGSIVALLIFRAFGYTDQQVADQAVPLGLMFLANVPKWVGFVGAPYLVARTKGYGLVHDFRLRFRPIDVPVGVAAGLGAQLILAPLLSWPVLELSGKSVAELERPARELADRAQGLGGTTALILLAVICAPIAEELFFRGLVLRAFEKRFGVVWAVVATAVVFGATHFQPLQFLALAGAGAVFSVLAVRFDRLGPAIIAHMAFNAVTVINLLWLAT